MEGGVSKLEGYSKSIKWYKSKANRMHLEKKEEFWLVGKLH